MWSHVILTTSNGALLEFPIDWNSFYARMSPLDWSKQKSSSNYIKLIKVNKGFRHYWIFDLFSDTIN